VNNAQTISADDLFSEWGKDPVYVGEYEALEERFAIPSAVMAARCHAGLTQAELAKRMGTTQSVIARLETGRSKPSTATLEKLAKATGTKLRISFEPEKACLGAQSGPNRFHPSQ
jgi:ribosome-binding protein aMBF1 (putative translation factor)